MRLANIGPHHQGTMVGQQRPLVLPQRIDHCVAQFALLYRASVFVIEHRVGIHQGRCLVIHGRYLAGSSPDRRPLGVVVNDDANIVALVMCIDMQLNGRSDVPLALHHAALCIQAQNVRRRQLSPGQLPWIGKVGPIVQAQRDVPGNMVVIAFARKHSAQQSDLLTLVQSGQQRLATRARCVLGKQLVIQTVVAHTASFVCCGVVISGWRANTDARCMRRWCGA